MKLGAGTNELHRRRTSRAVTGRPLLGVAIGTQGFCCVVRVDHGATSALQLRSHSKVAKMRLILCFRGGGMRSWFLALVVVAAWCGAAVAQGDKKTDDDKPADPDTGESTVEEKTLGLLPNSLQKFGIKFAATYIGETLGNVSGGIKQGAVYEGRLNLA